LITQEIEVSNLKFGGREKEVIRMQWYHWGIIIVLGLFAFGIYLNKAGHLKLPGKKK
jgi:hypothetical protein